jgi:hypothetical protein
VADETQDEVACKMKTPLQRAQRQVCPSTIEFLQVGLLLLDWADACAEGR